MRETVGPETLYATPFVVHRDQQIAPDSLDLPAQLGQLPTVLPVPAEQDDPTDQGMVETAAVVVAQPQAGYINDQGSCMHLRRPSVQDCSTTTKVAA